MIITGLQTLWPHESKIYLKSLFYGVIKGWSCNNGNHLLNILSRQTLIHASHMFMNLVLKFRERKRSMILINALEQTSFNHVITDEPESKYFFNILESKLSNFPH